jgi:hypothetical protein
VDYGRSLFLETTGVGWFEKTIDDRFGVAGLEDFSEPFPRTIGVEIGVDETDLQTRQHRGKCGGRLVMKHGHDVASAKTVLNEQTRDPIRELVELGVTRDLATGRAESRPLCVSPRNFAKR